MTEIKFNIRLKIEDYHGRDLLALSKEVEQAMADLRLKDGKVSEAKITEAWTMERGIDTDG